MPADHFGVTGPPEPDSFISVKWNGRLVVEDGHSPHIGYEAAMNITFNSVTDYVGPVPALVGNVNNLEGLRRIDVYRNREGIAGLGGTYKLRFRGETTAAISFQATDKEVEAALKAQREVVVLKAQQEVVVLNHSLLRATQLYHYYIPLNILNP